MPILGKKTVGGSVGLDIDGTYLAAVQTSGGGVSRATSTELDPGVIVDGEVSDVAGLTEALKVFFRDNQLPRSVRLGVANQQIAVRHLEMPHIEDDKERDAAVRFQAADAIAMPLDGVVLDHQVIGETFTPDGASRAQVMVVAARRSMIDRLVEAVQGAGLKPAAIDLNAFALVRTLADPWAAADSARVYCHLGGVTNLAVASGSTCLFTRPLSAVFDGDGESTATALAEEIRLSIDFYMTQPGARPAGDLVLSGPGSTRQSLAGELEALIGLPVSVASPLGGLISALSADEDPYRYTVAAGLTLGETE